MAKSPEAFRTISEAASELELPQHVLRFWETRFSHIKPLKRGGGRRYYRPDDVALLRGIRHLLYDKGFTIKGVQRILKEQGVRHVIDFVEQSESRLDVESPKPATLVLASDEMGDADFQVSALAEHPAGKSANTAQLQSELAKIMAELLDCKRLLDAARE